MDVGSEVSPTPVRCSEERLADGGVFLLENGQALFLWLGQASPPDVIQSLFNVPSLAHLQAHMVRETASMFSGHFDPTWIKPTCCLWVNVTCCTFHFISSEKKKKK